MNDRGEQHKQGAMSPLPLAMAVCSALIGVAVFSANAPHREINLATNSAVGPSFPEAVASEPLPADTSLSDVADEAVLSETDAATEVGTSRAFGTLTSNPPLPAFLSPLDAALAHAPIMAANPTGFGESTSMVEQVITEQFGRVEYLAASNLEDVAVVDDPAGDYLLTRSDVGSDSRKQWNVPIEPAQEAYLVYRFMLEPGFDAGDGNGDEGSPAWGTGIKMPGLMRGNPGDNTGGEHTPGGFSGRLMIRGTESSGSASASRDGLTLSAYIYGQEINDEAITSGFGRDFYFLDGFGAEPFEGIENGTREGVGDPRIWELTEGEWITVVLGYRVDGDNGWFKAWTATGGGSLQPRLHVPNINWNGGDSTAGPDSILFQQFWGGSGSVWYPDEVSYTRFKDFAVHTNETDALTAANFLAWPIPVEG